MRIGVVSDTHGHRENTRRAVRLLAKQGVEAVLHCGDIVGADLIPLFAEWPTHFVFGNCDGNSPELRAAIRQAGQSCDERFGDFELAGRRIALIHGDEHWNMTEAIESGQYDLVCYGHTHLPEQHRVGKTLVLNPGALYRANPHTIAVVDLAMLKAEHIALSAAE